MLSQAKSGIFPIGQGIGQGALLSEPWSDVLVRAFATAGAVLISPALVPNGSSLGQDDAFKRAEHCVEALRFLGQRSDKALSAASLLTEELKSRRERGDKSFPRAVSCAGACAG
jgi:hypothetical protein